MFKKSENSPSATLVRIILKSRPHWRQTVAATGDKFYRCRQFVAVDFDARRQCARDYETWSRQHSGVEVDFEPVWTRLNETAEHKLRNVIALTSF